MGDLAKMVATAESCSTPGNSMIFTTDSKGTCKKLKTSSLPLAEPLGNGAPSNLVSFVVAVRRWNVVERSRSSRPLALAATNTATHSEQKPEAPGSFDRKGAEDGCDQGTLTHKLGARI